MLKISEFLKAAYVAPLVTVKYREMVEEMLAKTDDGTRDKQEMEFYREQCMQLNFTLAEIQRGGKQLCHANYTVSTVNIFKDAADHPIFGFDDRSIVCTPESLAELWTAVKLMQRQHNHNLIIYRGYDEYEQQFVDLAPELDKVGGQIEFKRPEFIITIPDGYFSLVTRERTLHGVERDYQALKNQLGICRNNSVFRKIVSAKGL